MEKHHCVDGKVVEDAIEKGIDVNQPTKNGQTPLWIAAWEGHKEIVSMLVEAKGVDVNQADKDGQTPLFRAAYEGHKEIVSMLLKVKVSM